MSTSPSPAGAGVVAVRLARPGDADALQGLYQDARRTADWLPATSRATSNFAADSEGELVLCATGPGGALAGLLALYRPTNFIHHLYVAAPFRRRGVASALLLALESQAERPWRLKCLCANTNALGFYLRRGWSQIGSGHGNEGAWIELELGHAPKSKL